MSGSSQKEVTLETATSADRATQKVSVQQFIEALRKLKEDDFTGVNGTLRYLRENSVDPESLAPYLFWNPQHYTRNLIDKTDLYELLAICWEVGQGSSVHNHRDQNCWMAAPVGKLLVENFHVGFQDIEAGKCQLVASNTVELTAAN